MGAWDCGIFDDDTAYDFDVEIKNDARVFFKSSFENAMLSEYLEYEEGHAVIVSAAYIDNLVNGTKYRNDNEELNDESNVNVFGILYKDLEVEDLKLTAVDALKKVIDENSELNELWAENEELYPKWKQNILDIIHRLS
jgi:hydroxymethylpyrimidine pyrophosphatase-like HAD family hydrolase